MTDSRMWLIQSILPALTDQIGKDFAQILQVLGVYATLAVGKSLLFSMERSAKIVLVEVGVLASVVVLTLWHAKEQFQKCENLSGSSQ